MNMTDSLMGNVTHRALILVVEDEAALARDIVEELEEAGYRTLAAADGRQALALLVDATPDLVLCDISMPGLNGYALLETFRKQRPELATTPFIFLTALSEPSDVIEGKLLGADDYLVKPVDYDLMLATVGAHLRQVERIRRRHEDEMATLHTAISGLSGDGAEQALDLIALGIVLIDEQGRCVYANRAADELAVSGDIIRLDTDRIRAVESLSDKALKRALGETLEAVSSGKEKVVGVMLQQSQGARSMSALACALVNADVLPDEVARQYPGQPVVALFLCASGQRRRAPEALLAGLFGLTPTEARVASALANSARTTDVAAELGVSQTTIAFHMRNLFQKTGTNRQADLIALILAGPMMIQSE
ncbi:MAG: response regulator [Halomonas sp.]|uniref:response regulator n=1 Tax=Halomonas sp. TaxID=1486246 RepID=UPI003F92ECC1